MESVKLAKRSDGRPGIDRLWDSQWVNVVNAPEVLEALRNYEYEEAVNIAVRLTEQKMAENFASAESADTPTTDVLRIPEQPGLDPITCYFEDYAPGRGRITIACYGDAWTAAWGAMGNRTVREFLASAPSDYLACSLLELTPATPRRRKYAERIASAVIAALASELTP